MGNLSDEVDAFKKLLDGIDVRHGFKAVKPHLQPGEPQRPKEKEKQKVKRLLEQALSGEGMQPDKPLAKAEPIFKSSTWEDLKGFIDPIEWDWMGWLPRGFLTILAAEPGMGKSLLCLRVAGSFLAGRDWPDGRPFEGEWGKVIWCEGEGSQSLNLARAEGMELALEDFVSPLPHPMTAFRMDDEKHVLALIHFCRQPDVRLVVMDSLSSLVVGGPTETVGSSLAVKGIPRALYYLGEIARITNKPFLVTHHLRKRTAVDENGRISLERIRGTSRIAQAARVVWTLDAPDPADPQHRRLAVAKNNLMPPAQPLGMKIHKNHLEFGPPPEAAAAEKLSHLATATAFLLELLDQGPVPATEIFAAAQQAGIPKPTLRRAKKTLNIQSHRLPDLTWTWSLP